MNPRITIPAIKADQSQVAEQLKQNGVKVNIDTVNWAEFSYAPKVTALLGHDDSKLWCLFEVNEQHIHIATTEDNGPVWEDSCVEIFIMDADGKHYFNFETNAASAMLVGRRLSRDEFELLDAEHRTGIVRQGSLPRETTDLRDKDGLSWTMLVGIPFNLLGYKTVPSKLKLNIYKCGDKTDTPHFLSFAPIGTAQPDFHRPEYFTTVDLK